MARTEAEALPDRPALERRLSRVRLESSPPAKTERPHRNGVPINRGQRAHLELPVLVCAQRQNEDPLREVARTLVIYEHGALIALNATVEPGEELVLVNPKSGAEAECRVAKPEPGLNGGKFVVKVEFTQPAPAFWGVVFPPEDWDPAERKLPRPPRSFPRVQCSQTVRVRPADDGANDFADVCSTQNISRESLYFTSGHSCYRKGMRLFITFLSHSDFFTPNSKGTGQVVRVDQGKDGHVGVAVKLLGRIK